MSKFGLLESDSEIGSSQQTISDRLAEFSTTRQRHAIDIAQVDAAAAPHGFVSREPKEAQTESASPLRAKRRRAVPPELTRHLALRLTSGQYDRFVAYADRYQLTYQDALIRLLDVNSE